MKNLNHCSNLLFSPTIWLRTSPNTTDKPNNNTMKRDNIFAMFFNYLFFNRSKLRLFAQCTLVEITLNPFDCGVAAFMQFQFPLDDE